MNDLVCLERTGAFVRARLAEPGFLRGRQRSPSFIEDAVKFMLYLARVHGRAEHEHIFPLSRMPMGGLVNLGLAEHTIRRLIPKMVEAGFIEPVNGLKRRYETGTVSPSEGAKGSWWFPRLFKLAQAIRTLFGKSPPAPFQTHPPENQCDQNETLNLEELEEGEEVGFINHGSTILVASPKIDEAVEAEDLPEMVNLPPKIYGESRASHLHRWGRFEHATAKAIREAEALKAEAELEACLARLRFPESEWEERGIAPRKSVGW